MCSSMRPLIIAVVLATCFFARERANALSSSELMESCQAVTDSTLVRGGATLDIPEAGLPCWYYMSAVQNMAVLVDTHGHRLLGVCPPADSTVLDFVRIYVSRRTQINEADNAVAAALPGLARAFPCR